MEKRGRVAETCVVPTSDGWTGPCEQIQREKPKADWVDDDGDPCEQQGLVVRRRVALDGHVGDQSLAPVVKRARAGEGVEGRVGDERVDEEEKAKDWW